MPLPSPPQRSSDQQQPTNVRFAEKRRQSSCAFADRVAQCSIDWYRSVVPSSFREEQKQTCLATVVAHDAATNQLHVLALGVGTKFLREQLLREEEEEPLPPPANDGTTPTKRNSMLYGRRVRDLHAEVLARRALHRCLVEEMMADVQRGTTTTTTAGNSAAPTAPVFTLLERVPSGKETNPTATTASRAEQQEAHIWCWRLRSTVTLHAYCSSAPCGNAVLKKFANLRETMPYQEHLTPDQWPEDHPHPTQLGHSVAQGQFALLVKKDHYALPSACPTAGRSSLSPEPQQWYANQSTDWCPSGTTTVWSQQGSLHSCSDKLCRWNCLGWQGALLSSVLERPLYVTTLGVGRKLSLACCRRAVCCRVALAAIPHQKKKKKARVGPDTELLPPPFRVHHPVVLANAVYMDETAAVRVNAAEPGQDVRFHSNLCWVWYPGCGPAAQGIDGSTGFATELPTTSGNTSTSAEAGDPTEVSLATTPVASTAPTPAVVSSVSTAALVGRFLELRQQMTGEVGTPPPRTLQDLLSLKRTVAPLYEEAKESLLTKHPILRQWKQRGRPRAVPPT